MIHFRVYPRSGQKIAHLQGAELLLHHRDKFPGVIGKVVILPIDNKVVNGFPGVARIKVADWLWIGKMLDIALKIKGDAQSLGSRLAAALQVFYQEGLAGDSAGIGNCLISGGADRLRRKGENEALSAKQGQINPGNGDACIRRRSADCRVIGRNDAYQTVLVEGNVSQGGIRVAAVVDDKIHLAVQKAAEHFSGNALER